MLQNQPRILFPLGFLKWEPAPLSFLLFFRLEYESKTYLFLYFDLVVTLIHQIPCDFAGLIFLMQICILCPLRKLGGERAALVSFTLLNFSSRRNIDVVPRYLGEFDGAI